MDRVGAMRRQKNDDDRATARVPSCPWMAGSPLHLYTAERMRAFSYRAPLKIRAGEWIDVAVPLDRFEATSFGRVLRRAGPANPRRVTSIGFSLAEKTPGPLALEVAWIKVLRGQGH